MSQEQDFWAKDVALQLPTFQWHSQLKLGIWHVRRDYQEALLWDTFSDQWTAANQRSTVKLMIDLIGRSFLFRWFLNPLFRSFRDGSRPQLALCRLVLILFDIVGNRPRCFSVHFSRHPSSSCLSLSVWAPPADAPSLSLMSSWHCMPHLWSRSCWGTVTRIKTLRPAVFTSISKKEWTTIPLWLG